jgi:hypothetical protein
MYSVENTYFKFLPSHILATPVSKDTLPFSQNLFWDTSLSNIKLDSHKTYIIERVITRGLLHDLYYLLQIYSTIEIINVLKKSKQLDNKTANFCSIFFNIPHDEIHAASYYN